MKLNRRGPGLFGGTYERFRWAARHVNRNRGWVVLIDGSRQGPVFASLSQATRFVAEEVKRRLAS